MKLKIGDKIKCISSVDVLNLTYGKIYTVTNHVVNCELRIFLINDSGEENSYKKERFIKMKGNKK
jgi:hypothetical protein